MTENVVETSRLMDLGEVGAADIDWTRHYEEFFRRTGLPEAPILDVASNDARLAKWCRSRGFSGKIISFDIRDFFHPPANYVRGTARKMPFIDNAFPSVVSFGALHTLCEPTVSKEVVLNEMLRVSERRVLFAPIPPEWGPGDLFVRSAVEYNNAIISRLLGMLTIKDNVCVEVVSTAAMEVNSPLSKIAVLTKKS